MYMIPTVTSCVERLARASVDAERAWPSDGQHRLLEELEDLVLGGAVEDRRGHVHPAADFRASFTTSASQAVDERADVRTDIVPERARSAACLEPRATSSPRICGPSRAPPTRGASRGSARRSFATARRAGSGRCRPACRPRGTACPPRAGSRQHALVAVAPGHLVADLQLALDGDEHLDHLDDAGRQLVARLEALDLLVEDRARIAADLLLASRPRRATSVDRVVAPIPDVAPVADGGSARASPR
jgi:hypothetical protein